MTDFHNNYNGIVSAQANQWMPTSNQRDVRLVVNPVGIPAGTYLIWYDVADPNSILTQAQFALDMTTNAYWVRTPAALHNTWNAWTNIFGGGGGPGVSSWTGAQGTMRVGPVVAINGDYTASMVTNVPAGGITSTDVQAALNELDTKKVSSWTGAQGTTQSGGAVVATSGDYTAAMITNTPAGNITSTDVQAALNELDTKKVTLGNAVAAQDILVATAPGDNYVPSQTLVPGRIGALNAGQFGNATQTVNGAVIEAVGDGPTLASSLIRAILGAAGTTQNGFSAFFGDVLSDATFGQGAGVAQSVLRMIMPALPAAVGGDGAYAITLEVGPAKPFFVNAVGQVELQLAPGPAVTQLGLNAAGMVCAFP